MAQHELQHTVWSTGSCWVQLLGRGLGRSHSSILDSKSFQSSMGGGPGAQTLVPSAVPSSRCQTCTGGHTPVMVGRLWRIVALVEPHSGSSQTKQIKDRIHSDKRCLMVPNKTSPHPVRQDNPFLYLSVQLNFPIRPVSAETRSLTPNQQDACPTEVAAYYNHTKQGAIDHEGIDT